MSRHSVGFPSWGPLILGWVLSLALLPLPAWGEMPAWPQFPLRVVRPLDGVWQFAYLGTSVNVTAFSPQGVATNASMTVPGAWDLSAFPNLAGAHGSALYRRTVWTTPNAWMRIYFAGCMFYCVVWVDGVKVAEHGGNGYSAYWVGGIAPSGASQRLVEVLADNRFLFPLSPLHAYVDDWYQYGGLIRSVQLHELPSVSLARADVLIVDAPAGLVDVRLRLHALDETSWWRLADVDGAAASGFAPRYYGNGPPGLPHLPAWVDVELSFDGAAPVSFARVPVSAADGAALLVGLSVPAPTPLWSPNEPAVGLHVLSVRVTNSSLGPPSADDVILERFGLRSVSVCGADGGGSGPPVVCINGAPTKLLGFGRHDTSAHEGHALSDFARQQDIALARGAGANFLRLGHYTQSPTMTALCDDAGMLNGVEVIGWDSSVATYSNATWLGAGIIALEETMNHSYGFNSVATITYAYINEGTSNVPSVCPAWALFNNRYKTLRVNGLTTYANDQGTADVCIGPSGVDLVGLNTYPGWYEAPAADPSLGWSWQPSVALVRATLDAFADWMNATHPGIPFYVSEQGAGAIPGWSDAMSGYWSETYAARLIDAGVRTITQDSRWSGHAVWQLMDQRVYQGVEALGRPRSFNNKGVHDEHRRPKLPLWIAVKAAFTGQAQPAFLVDDALQG